MSVCLTNDNNVNVNELTLHRGNRKIVRRSMVRVSRIATHPEKHSSQ